MSKKDESDKNIYDDIMIHEQNKLFAKEMDKLIEELEKLKE